MSEIDVFELLRVGDPAPLAALDGPDSERGRRILARVMANADQLPAPRRARRRLAIVIAALLALIAATAAAWYVATRDVTDPAGTACYDAPELGGTVVVPRVDGPPTVEACASLWADGVLPVDGPTPEQTVPDLVGCVTDTGTLAVFPSTDAGLCSELGLTGVADTANGPAVHDLQDSLFALVNPDTCLSLEEARQVTRAELDQLGLELWVIFVRDENPDRPCASFSIESEHERVVLTPVPR